VQAAANGRTFVVFVTFVAKNVSVLLSVELN